MLIINANIFTMDTNNIANYPNGFLQIDQQTGFISAIGLMEDLPSDTGELIDAKGGFLYPGFIDAHCHIGMYGDGLGFESDDINEETDPITPQLSALDAVNPFDQCFCEAVAGGVTTVLTGPGSANPIAGKWLAMKTGGAVEPVMEKLLISRYVGMKFALGENPKVSYNQKSLAPITRMATAALIREQLTKTQHYLKELEDSVADSELDEPEYDAKCEALIPVLKGEVKAFFHCHRADDICTAIRISREFSLDSVIVHGTEGYKLTDTLLQAGYPVITGPIISDRSKPELKGLTAKNSGILEKAGIKVAVCTDHPELPIQYLPLSAAVACREGMEEEAALRAITITAAEISGISGNVGSLTVGKDGDCVLLTGSPFDLRCRVIMTIICGKVCYSSDTSSEPKL